MTPPHPADAEPAHGGQERIRIDQWLWFARFYKSRSLAGRFCAATAIAINGSTVAKPNQSLRVGDIVVLPQGPWQRTVRVLALGTRRGPASEARQLYEEAASPVRRQDGPQWEPLLDDHS